jgi:hypothetical protein
MLARLQLTHTGTFLRNASARYVHLNAPPPTDHSSETIENTQETSADNNCVFLPNISLVPYAECVHDNVVRMCKTSHASYGPNCSEALYQRAVLRAAYLHNFPAMQEREIFTDYGHGSLPIGRIDLEVASCCLYEFKCCKVNIEEHSRQLQRYLRAYDNNKECIRVAALLYFTNTGVFVHRVR